LARITEHDGAGARARRAASAPDRARTPTPPSHAQTQHPPQALPGASAADHELLAELGRVLLAGGPGLAPDAAGASDAYSRAAAAAEAAFKGKLAARYYEAAARADAAAEEAAEAAAGAAAAEGPGAPAR
jgi:hypothetical protein